MRRRLSFLLASAVAMSAASAVSAGTLSSATWFQVTQGVPMTRSNNIGCIPNPDDDTTPGAAPHPCFEASGTSTFAGTSIGVNLTFPFFQTSFFVPKTPNGTLDLHINVTQGGAQAIVATPNSANGSPGIPGTVVVMTAGHVGMGLNQSMFKVGINTLVAVPLSAGKADLFTGTFTVVGALHTISVQFFAWTPGTLTFANLTSKNAPLSQAAGGVPADNTVVAMGSFNLSASGGGGTVTLVSPSKVDIDGSLAQRRTAAFTKLTLAFIPEPGAVLLILGGALGLGVMGSFRR
jgi:hypothetical protein